MDWIKMTKDGEEKLVHPGNVNNHKRFGWVVVDAPLATQSPAEAVSTETAGSDVVTERDVALERFARMLGTARKKPGGATAKLLAELGVVIADPDGDAEPYPPHVLMAQTIDALVGVTDPMQRAAFLIALFGKSAEYARQLITEREQARAEEK